MIYLGIVKEGGQRLKLPDEPIFFEPEVEMALNKWIDLVRIRPLVNDHGNT